MLTAINGGIYLVSDAAISMPPEDFRKPHQQRRSFLVLSSPETNSDLQWPVVFGCPLSTADHYSTRFDAKLAAGEGNVNKKCWVRVTLAQPLAKNDLQDFTGTLSAQRLQEVQSKLLWYMGMISHEPEKDPNG